MPPGKPVPQRPGVGIKIPPPDIKHAQVPKPTKVAKDQGWTFSFRFWRQVEHFSLDNKGPEWFVALLERFSEICSELREAFNGDPGKHKAYRYHKINWGQTNIPIQRKNLSWLPPDYLGNDAEYPIYQFSIAKGLGRVAGFWDENRVFNVVLIDPHHNLQPAGDFNYRVTPSYPIPNEIEVLTAKIRRLRDASHDCTTDHCATKAKLDEIDAGHVPYVLYLEGEYLDQARKLVSEGKARTVEEILEDGILARMLRDVSQDTSAETSPPPQSDGA